MPFLPPNQQCQSTDIAPSNSNKASRRFFGVGYSGQPVTCDWPYNPATWFWPHRTWCVLNHFHTGQGLCAAKLHKWGLASSDRCAYGMVQSHTADKCLGSKLHDGGLQRLYSLQLTGLKEWRWKHCNVQIYIARLQKFSGALTAENKNVFSFAAKVLTVQFMKYMSFWHSKHSKL